MLKSNFLLFLAIGGLFSVSFKILGNILDIFFVNSIHQCFSQLTRVDHTAAAPTKNAANAGSKMLLPTESLQLTDTATNQNLLPMASGQLVSTVNNKNLLPIASSQIADTAKKQTLHPTESVLISDNLKNLDLLPMESVQIAGKSMNQSLLQMENGKLSNQNLLSLASSQIGKIADNQMKKLEIADTYKNQSLFPMENLQVAESAKSHRLFPFENVPQLAGSTEKQLFLAVPSEVDRVTNNAMKSLDATNDDLPIYDTRLLPLGYKLKASDLRAMPSQPLFNYKRTSHAHMPQYDRFETQKARIDYYRPLSSYREKYYMKKDGRDSDFRIPFLKSNDSVPRELVQNFDNLLAAPKDKEDKEEPDKEITIPLPESAHNATEVQLRVQARARRNYYPGCVSSFLFIP